MKKALVILSLVYASSAFGANCQKPQASEGQWMVKTKHFALMDTYKVYYQCRDGRWVVIRDDSENRAGDTPTYP
jgi:hypothetical protein